MFVSVYPTFIQTSVCNGMKTKLFTTIFLLLICFSPTLAQDRLQFGLRSNIGLFGVKHPNGYELIDETLLRVDGFFKYPNIALSAGVLMEYTFFKAGDLSMALQLEFGNN